MGLLLSVSLAGFASTSHGAQPRKCDYPSYASGGLIVRGEVSCRTADGVIKQALRKPGCQASKSDASSGRGCTGTTRVSGWTCKGLFPGEGFDLRCTSKRRVIHGSAGG